MDINMNAITSAQIKIESDDDLSSIQKYHNLLRTMLLTPEGTMIGNRDFGVSFDLLSMQPNHAINMLVMELEKKIPVFIPDIEVSGVDWTADKYGRTVFRIHIRKANS